MGSLTASDPKVAPTFGIHPMLFPLSSASFGAENRVHFSARRDRFPNEVPGRPLRVRDDEV
jgi:hypothetical protein